MGVNKYASTFPMASCNKKTCNHRRKKRGVNIAPDKAAYCVFKQLLGPKNAIKLISVRTKTQLKFLILNSELFHSV